MLLRAGWVGLAMLLFSVAGCAVEQSPIPDASAVAASEPEPEDNEDVAIRIEDDVLVTGDGCEALTHLPRDLASMTAFT